MPNFSKLPNVFAWQHEDQWYYAEERSKAPSHAIEMSRLDDGREILLSISHGVKGSFIRNAKPLEVTPLR
ncbi:hypothetical protein [Lacipirellula sp.]|uniref:hypothetical protein n=1 Tax=Lacipirellula sp. TaxID=2691419 RepID=UPI003D135515